VKFFGKTLLATTMLALGFAGHASAQSQSALDKIEQSKVLRCGIMLDSPPAGYRDENNQPDGYDVAYCKDMAAALGAEPVVVEVSSPDRIPALVSNRIDVLVASTTPTPQRELTVAFSQPYTNNVMVVVTHKGTGINVFSDLKGKRLGGVVGTTPEQLFKSKMATDWKNSGTTYTGYASDAETDMALEQGKVDAILIDNSVFRALSGSGQFPNLVMGGPAPLNDWGSIAVRRDDFQFLNWVRMFVFQQVQSGRFAELYKKYYGVDAPPLTADGVTF
jgi:hydroxyproline transporter system substrate-binding protein